MHHISYLPVNSGSLSAASAPMTTTERKPASRTPASQPTVQASSAAPSSSSLSQPLSAFLKPFARHESGGSDKSVPTHRLWVDLHAPNNEVERVFSIHRCHDASIPQNDCAVHKKKIEDVRIWLKGALSSDADSTQIRILLLTGPAGLRII